MARWRTIRYIDKCKGDDDIKVHGGEIRVHFQVEKKWGFFYNGFEC